MSHTELTDRSPSRNMEGAGGMNNYSDQARPGLRAFKVSMNRFTGVLPERSFRQMSSVKDFSLGANEFKGSLSASVEVMTAVTHFDILSNGFMGTLPSSGIGAMRALTAFVMHNNSFTGALPDNGIGAMTGVDVFRISTNSFTGVLP
eukprot:139015-Amphidinium_carterae.1